VYKKALQISHLIKCPQKKKWKTKSLKNNDDWKTKELKGHKKTNKEKKLGCLISYYSKFLEDGLVPHGVESVCNVYLKHHPMKMAFKVT
jgi:hypothetical protein